MERDRSLENTAHDEELSLEGTEDGNYDSFRRELVWTDCPKK